MQMLLKRQGHHGGCGLAVFAFIVSALGSFAATSQSREDGAQAAFQKGSFNEAATCCQQAAKEFKKQGDMKGQVAALVRLAGAYQALGQHPKAVENLKEAVAIA